LKKFDNFFRIASCVSRIASEEILGRRLPKLTGNFLATKTARREEKLTTDFTDFADLFGHKKAQKTQRN
jgi:hypothetical protein